MEYTIFLEEISVSKCCITVEADSLEEAIDEALDTVDSRDFKYHHSNVVVGKETHRENGK